MRGRNGRTLAATILLMVTGVTLLAAAVYVVLGEKEGGVSPSLWNVAVVLCRVITGLFGLLAIAPAVVGRGAGSSRDETLGAVTTAVILIAAAVVGLRLVIVITGLGNWSPLRRRSHSP